MVKEVARVAKLSPGKKYFYLQFFVAAVPTYLHVVMSVAADSILEWKAKRLVGEKEGERERERERPEGEGEEGREIYFHIYRLKV